jgi:hypothetical protein
VGYVKVVFGTYEFLIILETYSQGMGTGFTLEGERTRGSGVPKVEWFEGSAYLNLPLWAIEYTSGKFWLKDDCFGMCVTALDAGEVLAWMGERFQNLSTHMEAALFIREDRWKGKYFHTISIPVERMRYVSTVIHVFNCSLICIS